MCDVPSIAVFLVNLLNVFVAWLTNFSLNVLLLFRWLQLLLVLLLLLLLLLLLRQLKIKKHNINTKFQENGPHYSIALTHTQKQLDDHFNINIQRRARTGNSPTGE
jgi:hypothetical protein